MTLTAGSPTIDPSLSIDVSALDPDGTPLLAQELAYDPESNLASRTENGAATAYAYDNLYHLTGADAPGSAQDELWTYDLLGNRLTDLRQGGTQAWQYNADNQLLQSYNHLGQPVTYVYDAAGNLLRKQNPLAPAHSLESRQFVYDVSGRLSQVLDGNGALVADYRYDPFGRRISKSVYRDLQGEELAQPQSQWFVYAAEGLVAETTGAAQYENFYGWQPDGLWGTSPVFVRRLAENGWGENYWYLADHLGTPRQLVDSAGASVWVSSADTFGEPGFSEANAFDNRLGFAGQYFDAETGSFYNYFRNYDPASGRYLQADPLGLAAGINQYQYVGSNPGKNIDPTGERWQLYATSAVIGAIASGLTNIAVQKASAPGESIRWNEVALAGGIGAAVGGAAPALAQRPQIALAACANGVQFEATLYLRGQDMRFDGELLAAMVAGAVAGRIALFSRIKYEDSLSPWAYEYMRITWGLYLEQLEFDAMLRAMILRESILRNIMAGVVNNNNWWLFDECQ